MPVEARDLTDEDIELIANRIRLSVIDQLKTRREEERQAEADVAKLPQLDTPA